MVMMMMMMEQFVSSKREGCSEKNQPGSGFICHIAGSHSNVDESLRQRFAKFTFKIAAKDAAAQTNP